MPSINFNRSSENDLVWNSNTNSYEPVSEPSGTLVLTDGNGNVYVLNGSALVVGASVSEPVTATLSFTMGTYVTSYTIDGTTYSSNQNIELEEGNHTLSITSSYQLTGGLSINNNTMGLTYSCTFTIDGTDVEFVNSTYTYSATTSTTFNLTYGGGSSD